MKFIPAILFLLISVICYGQKTTEQHHSVTFLSGTFTGNNIELTSPDPLLSTYQGIVKVLINRKLINDKSKILDLKSMGYKVGEKLRIEIICKDGFFPIIDNINVLHPGYASDSVKVLSSVKYKGKWGGPVHYSKENTLMVKGIYNGYNPYYTNPFGSTGVGYCIIMVQCNGDVTTTQINGNSFAIDIGNLGIKINDSIEIKITHKVGCNPKIINPEVFIKDYEANLVESISFGNDSTPNKKIAIKDSLCVISGKITNKSNNDYIPCLIFLKDVESTGYGKQTRSHRGDGTFAHICEYGYKYELEFTQKEYISQKFIIDLRGIPKQEHHARNINVSVELVPIQDKSMQTLMTKFALGKMSYNSVSKEIEWDMTYTDAIKEAISLLQTTISTQKNLSNSELNRKQDLLNLNLLEVQRQQDELTLLEKNSQLEGQQNELLLKEKEATIQKKESELKDIELEEEKLLAVERKKTSQYLQIGLLSLGVFLLLVLFLLRQRTKAKKEADEQRRISDIQKEKIEESHKEITDSINYAKRIQSAILPPLKVVKEYLQKSFILYKPKDVVAGDFYWMEHTGDKVLIAAADCTGHGVPGAMVSVVCNNALNRSVREYGLTDPGEILDKTREIVIKEFEQSEEDVKDGMDIALCSLQGNKLLYAGAHNPLWIIRNGEIIETKANKQPIGKFDLQSPYTTHSFDLQKGDTIYIFSDGYPDQFGGERGKKYKSGNFKKFLLSIQEHPMEKQHKLLDKEFETWRGKIEQIDDVCVIGIRI